MKDSMLAGENTPYFEWLIDRVGGAGWWEEYVYALIRLFERKYYFVNPLDKVMVTRGKALRTDAIIEGVEPISIPADAYEVSCLEALIGLAENVDEILMRSLTGIRRPERWFNDFMTVLGFKEESGEIDIQIDQWLSGKNQITHGRKTKPYVRTIWEQVNMFYLDQFELETDW